VGGPLRPEGSDSPFPPPLLEPSRVNQGSSSMIRLSFRTPLCVFRFVENGGGFPLFFLPLSSFFKRRVKQQTNSSPFFFPLFSHQSRTVLWGREIAQRIHFPLFSLFLSRRRKGISQFLFFPFILCFELTSPSPSLFPLSRAGTMSILFFPFAFPAVEGAAKRDGVPLSLSLFFLPGYHKKNAVRPPFFSPTLEARLRRPLLPFSFFFCPVSH